MKNISFYFILSVLMIFAMSSCEKTDSTRDLSRITYFPNFEYSGSSVLLVPCNSAFSDPGVTASENDEPITVNQTVSSTYFGGTADMGNLSPDLYSITYSAMNADGFSGEQYRQLWVSCSDDLSDSLEGLYSSTVVRNGVVSPQYSDLEYIIIKKTSGNTYAISDAIGGYYDFGRAYGPGYAAKGVTITTNNIATNDFSFSGPVGVGAFGGSCSLSDMTVDAAANTITFSANWDAGYVFVVTLTKVN